MPFAALRNFSWLHLLIGGALSGLIALSVHVVPADIFHVPFPSAYPRQGLLACLNESVALFALIQIYMLAGGRLMRRPVWFQGLLLFLFDAMLRERFRATMMDGFLTGAWITALMQTAPRELSELMECLLVVTIAPRATLPRRAASAAVITAFGFFLLRPALEALLRKWAAPLLAGHPEVMSETSWPAEVVSYLSYAEPTIACFAVAALIWDRLPPRPLARAGSFIFLILLVKTTLVGLAIFLVYSPGPLIVSLLSYGQFTLETFTLALLTAVTILTGEPRSHGGSVSKF